VPCGPCYNLDEVLADPQVNARGLLEEVEHPGATKAVPIARTPVRLSETPAISIRRAPQLGEHTDEVLVELGFNVNEIAALRAAKAV
jgi:crotonobetainyl-CoA:carnitine CoA-transferase CaiB-like acyl-CoA transferase